MNSAQEVIPWSKRRWFWTVTGIFALHLVLIWNLSESRPARASRPVRVSSVQLLQQTQDAASEWFELHDPALFALTSPKGFSRRAWLTIEPFPYRLTNVIEPKYWLTMQSLPSAQNPRNPKEIILAAPFSGAEKPNPAVSNVSVPVQPSVIRPTFRLEGDLASRVLISTNPLPEAEADAVLANCVIAATVNAAGDVISHLPVASSGSPQTDAKAIVFTKSARFAPTPDPGALTIGNFVFQWTAVTLMETNTGAAK